MTPERDIVQLLSEEQKQSRVFLWICLAFVLGYLLFLGLLAWLAGQ